MSPVAKLASSGIAFKTEFTFREHRRVLYSNMPRNGSYTSEPLSNKPRISMSHSCCNARARGTARTMGFAARSCTKKLIRGLVDTEALFATGSTGVGTDIELNRAPGRHVAKPSDQKWWTC